MHGHIVIEYIISQSKLHSDKIIIKSQQLKSLEAGQK